ncbi:type VI secretion system tip protein VgrG [Serratia microhaemolytica]|uniref:type VI secretion system Vgr family protein n=1 Tax=Serratia microhaemolytica TaxID=2675110 RepID=UPI000FDD2BD3|nr:type VI secretion system tip protein VgrG [Serratia microhaemolytica]
MSASDNKPSGLQFTLAAGGQPAGTFAVVDFTLNEHYSSLFELELNLASVNPAIDFDAVLDRGAKLSVWQDGVLQRAVSGIVTCFEQGDTGFHQTRYRMEVRPSLWRLGLRRNSRIFQLETIEEIITKLLSEAQIVDYAFGLRYPHPAREFCVQYQETDLEFIQRLTAEEGIFYYFEFNNGRHTVVFADDSGALPKGSLLPYNPNMGAQAKECCINSFVCTAQVRPAVVQLKDYTFKNPRWDALFTKQASGQIYQRTSYEHFDFPGRFKDEQHGKDFTRYRLEALRNDANLGRGSGNDFRLQPGLLFTLSNHPRADLNNAWQPVSVQHIGQQPQAVEQDAGDKGTHLNTQFRFIPRQQTWRPSPLPKPLMDGPQIAMVVGPGNEEIFCDEHGRVRVQFPWDRYGNSDDHSSCWIRVSQPWAGQGWGMIAIPRVGQEVVVDFLHGDPDQPIVTGRTYHAVNRPSLKLPMAKTQMAFRSKTHKGEGYNELRFEDFKGQEGLFLHAQRDMTTEVLHDRTTTVKNNHTENVTVNQTVSVGNDQSITVTHDQTTTVKNNQMINVTVDQTSKIDGNQSTTVNGKQTTEVHKDQQITVLQNQSTEVQQNQKNDVTLNQTVTIGQNQTITVNQKQTTNVMQDQFNNISLNQQTQVGKNIVIAAGDSITLSCGAASIKLDSSGNITLSGVHIVASGEESHTINAKKVTSSGGIENVVEGAILKLNP